MYKVFLATKYYNHGHLLYPYPVMYDYILFKTEIQARTKKYQTDVGGFDFGKKVLINR